MTTYYVSSIPRLIKGVGMKCISKPVQPRESFTHCSPPLHGILEWGLHAQQDSAFSTRYTAEPHVGNR